MTSIKQSTLSLLLAFVLTFPIIGISQSSFDHLKEYEGATIVVNKVREDTLYINWVNKEKKLSQEDKASMISTYKAIIVRFNENLLEAIKLWNGENKLVISDSSSLDYKNYSATIAKAMEEGVKGIKLYSIVYSSFSLSDTKKYEDPIFGDIHQPSMMLIEQDLDSQTAKMMVRVLVAQGLPSIGLLGCYLNTIVAQKIDTEKEVTFKNKDVFYERMEELKTKTLLIPEQFLSDQLTKESIAKIYPYPFEILDENGIDEKLRSDERDNCVIYQIIPMTVTTRSGTSPMGMVTLKLSKSAIMYKPAIFDVVTGRRMDLYEIKMALAGSAGTDELTKGELKDILSQIEHE